MDKEELKKSVCINLRCVTQSSKGGVPLNQLQNDYRQLLGTQIPFKDLGYSSLENFLHNIPDVISLKRNADGSLIAVGVADAATAHIAKLISKQKPSKKSKSGSSKPAVVVRKWGSSGKTNSHQKAKIPLRDYNSFSPSTVNRNQEQNSRCIPLTHAQQELKKSVLINLRSVVLCSKDGVPLQQLQGDYKKFIGSTIPFQRLGFSTLLEFLQSIPDVIDLKVGANEQVIAVGVVDAATAHLFGNSVRPKPPKSVSPTNETFVNSRATVQISSEQRSESPSFFKLPQNTADFSNLNNDLKHVPAKNKVRKKTQPVYSVSELISKNKMKHASNEGLWLKVEPYVPENPLSRIPKTPTPNPNKIAQTSNQNLRSASAFQTSHSISASGSYKKHSSSSENSVDNERALNFRGSSNWSSKSSYSSVGSMDDIRYIGNKNRVASHSKKAEQTARRKDNKKFQDQIEGATISPMAWLHFVLFGPSNVEALREKLKSFSRFTCSTNSKEWKERIGLISQLPKKALHQCLFLLDIAYDLKDSKENLQDKLICFLASYTEESRANAYGNEKENEF